MLAILQYYDCSSVYRMIVVLGYVAVISIGNRMDLRAIKE